MPILTSPGAILALIVLVVSVVCVLLVVLGAGLAASGTTTLALVFTLLAVVAASRLL